MDRGGRLGFGAGSVCQCACRRGRRLGFGRKGKRKLKRNRVPRILRKMGARRLRQRTQLDGAAWSLVTQQLCIKSKPRHTKKQSRIDWGRGGRVRCRVDCAQIGVDARGESDLYASRQAQWRSRGPVLKSVSVVSFFFIRGSHRPLVHIDGLLQCLSEARKKSGSHHGLLASLLWSRSGEHHFPELHANKKRRQGSTGVGV